jgi:3-methyl-2-oxobutanoate hydroxymethyltransferase
VTYSVAEVPSKQRKKIRIPDLMAGKGQRRMTCLTCYDASFARLLEKTDLDLVLVGDSLGHVVQGKNTTTQVTVEEVAYHTRCVAAALRTPVLVGDMPFASAGLSAETTYKSAEILVRAGAEAVKIEGATKEICEQISCLTRHGIPVMGHIGLIPQSVHALGGYKMQGKDQKARDFLIDSAKRLEDAGVFSIVLEMVAEETSAVLTEGVRVPTVGIGSGSRCDGQILVLNDMLGMNLDFQPKFLRRFAELEATIVSAVGQYCAEVGSGAYPSL